MQLLKEFLGREAAFIAMKTKSKTGLM